MSCLGIIAAHDGRLGVTGRSSTNKVSIHDDSFGDNLVAGPKLSIPSDPVRRSQLQNLRLEIMHRSGNHA